MKRATDAPTIDEALVQQLVASQFPEWGNLPVRRVQPGGWDNVTFRLGDRMAVRLPSAAEYVPQIEKQHAWLPKLAPSLPLRIPEFLALGSPGDRYPWAWSITTWLAGGAATRERLVAPEEFARDLAEFLNALEGIEARGGPLPGPHNFHRGGSLHIYDEEARRAIEILKHEIDAKRAYDLWTNALGTTWCREPVWLHGDITCGNVLLNHGRLSAVIDFGMLGVGDPACDLAIAWTFLERRDRESFREALAVDDDTWTRGRAWALWKATIVAADLVRTNRPLKFGSK
jgi:aminoglycoside phosphotransferase (APT) family kinase protein